ncbi:MAG: hypothetical protein IJ218_03450 [Alphaproteobacteria bacterium]|nr:hypothetical protein [Alphaproteobacteria bacterium]
MKDNATNETIMADINKIAHVLVIIAFRDNSYAAKVLAETADNDLQKLETTIRKFDIPAERLDAETLRQQVTAIEIKLKQEQKLKQKPYAPRKIGKPCGFPKNMRRK